MRKLFSFCFLFLVSCGIPPRATQQSTPIAIKVAYTPSVKQFVNAGQSCATMVSEIALASTEVPTFELDIQNYDLVFRLGEFSGSGYAAALRNDSILLIVNSENSVLALTLDQVHDLYTGRITRWDAFGGAHQPTQVWVYPEKEDIRLIFDAVFLSGENLTSQALLAPDPRAMLEAIAHDPAAIGYIPQTWLADSTEKDQVRPLDINKKLADLLRQPVIAVSKTEPNGPLRQFLGCVQLYGR